MESITVILVVVSILVTIAIVAATTLGARKMISGIMSPLLAQQAETKRLLAVGIPCAARVLHIEQTGTSMAVMGEQSYELRFHLEVTPPPAMAYRGGTGPYRTEMVSLVPMLALPRVQPGCMITVRVDPQDPRKMAFESPTPPMQATYPAAPPPYSPSPMPGHGGAMAPYTYPQSPMHPGQPAGHAAAPAPQAYGQYGGWNRS